MKTVFTDISDIAHIWAHQSQEDAKNPARNFYMSGKIIFSYGRHFPIARHYENTEGVKVVLFTTRTYSNTTAKHIGVVRSACSHLDKIFCHEVGTNSGEPNHDVNFKNWIYKAEQITEKLIKAKKPEIYIQQLQSIAYESGKYAKFFNLDVPEILTKVLSVTDSDSVKMYMAEKSAIIAQQKQIALEREKKAFEKNLKLFREGKQPNIWNNNTGFDYLRLDGDRVRTSQGVEIPLAIALEFYNWMLNNGECVNCERKILSYSVQEVNAKLIRVGCHTIARKEMNMLYKEVERRKLLTV